MRSGFAKRRPVPIRRSALAHTMEKEVFKILFACSLSHFPRLIEKSGAPPLPNRLLHAVMIIISGKQSPTAPSAVVPIFGIRPI